MSSDNRTLQCFKAAVDGHFAAQSETLIIELKVAAALLVAWLDHLEGSELTGVANNLIVGLRVLLFETAGVLSLGLPHNALALLRSQIDVVYGWIYYKDHPVEWNYANEHEDRWMLKSAVEDYLSKHDKRWIARMKALSDRSTEKNGDLYRVLSAYVHMQTSSAIPDVKSLIDLVDTNKTGHAVRLQQAVSEHINDVLISYYADDFMKLPEAITRNIKTRLTKNEIGAFCSIENPEHVAKRVKAAKASTGLRTKRTN